MNPSSFAYSKSSTKHRFSNSSKRSSFLRLCGIAAAVLLFTHSSAYGQDNSNSQTDIRPEDLGTVISVQISYADGEWRQLAAPEVIHCRAPQKAYRPTIPAKISILDMNGELISQRVIDDPRLILPEDPREVWSRADHVEMAIEIPLTGSPSTLDFTEDFENRTSPNLSIDLTGAIDDFLLNGAKRVPNCEQADPPFSSVRGQDLFVLKYALTRASEASGLPEAEIREILSKYGKSGVRKIRMHKAVQELLLQSIYAKE